MFKDLRLRHGNSTINQASLFGFVAEFFFLKTRRVLGRPGAMARGTVRKVPSEMRPADWRCMYAGFRRRLSLLLLSIAAVTVTGAVSRANAAEPPVSLGQGQRAFLSATRDGAVALIVRDRRLWLQKLSPAGHPVGPAEDTGVDEPLPLNGGVLLPVDKDPSQCRTTFSFSFAFFTQVASRSTIALVVSEHKHCKISQFSLQLDSIAVLHRNKNGWTPKLSPGTESVAWIGSATGGLIAAGSGSLYQLSPDSADFEALRPSELASNQAFFNIGMLGVTSDAFLLRKGEEAVEFSRQKRTFTTLGDAHGNSCRSTSRHWICVGQQRKLWVYERTGQRNKGPVSLASDEAGALLATLGDELLMRQSPDVLLRYSISGAAAPLRTKKAAAASLRLSPIGEPIEVGGRSVLSALHTPSHILILVQRGTDIEILSIPGTPSRRL